eukprot:1340333-Prorocentrum_lima.AAC.1
MSPPPGSPSAAAAEVPSDPPGRMRKSRRDGAGDRTLSLEGPPQTRLQGGALLRGVSAATSGSEDVRPVRA